MNIILKKVKNCLPAAKEAKSDGIYIVNKKTLRVKIQYIKNKDEYFFTIHRLKKDGKHTTFKSWYYSKYMYNPNTDKYELVREGKYVWNKK